jgi:hypothetical protein
MSGERIYAQVSGTFYEGERITSVNYVFENQLTDSLAGRNIEQTVKRAFPVFPQTTVRILLLDAYTNKVRKLNQVADAQYEVRPSQMGGIEITLTVVITDEVKEQKDKTGLLAGGKGFSDALS